jgi:hypothetical protein
MLCFFKYFLPNIFAKKWRFWLKTKLNFEKKLITTLVFRKNANFLPKIVENRRKLWSQHQPLVGRRLSVPKSRSLFCRFKFKLSWSTQSEPIYVSKKIFFHLCDVRVNDFEQYFLWHQALIEGLGYYK